MIKKGVLFGVLFLILAGSFVFAEDIDLSKDGYKCLKKQINDKICSGLSLDEKIFSLLSTGLCGDELLSSKKSQGCWGSSSSCDLVSTAQAIISLNSQNLALNNSLSWLSSQNKTATDVAWLLQIDSLSGATCTINNSASSYQVQIQANEKLNSSATSSCFSIDSGEYWISVSSSCYDEEISISCDKSFSTSLFFKSPSSSVIHVLDESATSDSQKIISKCFKSGSFCDYEGTLWTVFVLDLLGEDISDYLPYLIAMKDSNLKYIPDAFLYYLTADEDFSSSLKSKQNSNGYWDDSTHRYYDSAVALFPFQDETSPEKTKAINWLKDNQGKSGCWNSDDIKDTAFLLYSLWPTSSANPPAPQTNGTQQTIFDCKEKGYYCMSSASCTDAGGNELDNYVCNGFNKCCNKDKQETTCDDIGGNVCESDEVCQGTSHNEISTDSGGVCCDGACELQQQQETSECEENYGACKNSCDSNEEEASYSCTESSDVCCTTKERPPFNYLWLIILFAVLVITLVLFLLRKKLFQKSSSQQPKQTPGRPRMPPARMPVQGAMPPRRIVQQAHPPVRKPVAQPQRPLTDETLKKLREMSG